MNNRENVDSLKRRRTPNTEVINLTDLAKRLFIPRNILIMIIVGILAGTLSFLYSKYILPEMYTSSIMVYVSNNNSIVIGEGIDTQTITGSRSLAESGVVILKSDYVMEKVGSKLLEKYSEDELSENFMLYEAASGGLKIKTSSISSCFTITPVNETEVLQVTAVTKDPELSADMCNILAEMAPDFMKGIVGGGTVEAIGEAQIPLQKSSPSNARNALTGTFAGIIVIGGIFSILILTDNKIRDAESFKSKFDYPVFEEIPYIESGKAEGTKKKNRRKASQDDIGDILDGADSSQSFRLTEVFNTLGNNLAVALSMNDEKIVVVSSADENDGKSTVSVNLAKSMAKLEKKVLLIDLDLRKGTLHKHIKTANKNGVIDIIGKNADFDSCVKKNVYKNLDVLLTGGTSPNSMGILSSKKMKSLIEKCSEKYDFIVIDSPPINVVGDACVISQFAGGMVVVLRANRTSFDDVNRLIENVRLSNGRIIGFVVNFAGVNAPGYGYYKRKGYGYYKHGYGYGYYGTAEKTNKEAEQ